MINQQPIIKKPNNISQPTRNNDHQPTTTDQQNQQQKQGEEQELQHRIGVDWGLRKSHIQPIHQKK